MEASDGLNEDYKYSMIDYDFDFDFVCRKTTAHTHTISGAEPLSL